MVGTWHVSNNNTTRDDSRRVALGVVSVTFSGDTVVYHIAKT